MRLPTILLSSFILVGCTPVQVNTSYLPNKPQLPAINFCRPSTDGCIEKAAACLDKDNLDALYIRDQLFKVHIKTLEKYIRDIQRGEVSK